MADNLTSSVSIVLKDDVTGHAVDIAASLQKMEARAKDLDAAFSKSIFTDKFTARMKLMGASATHVDAVSKAWDRYAKAEGLAANRKDWTAQQAKSVKNWENVTLASTRAVLGAERSLEQAQAKRASAVEIANRRMMSSNNELVRHTDHTLKGIAALYAAHNFMHLAARVGETYRDFDKERRYGAAVMGITAQQQEPLVQQAIRGGATTKFNDIQWLESQRELASRGYKTDQVMAFSPVAATIAQAFDKSMPEGVKALEGAMLGFGKDVSTFEKAMQNAGRTADLQVKASKISGMDYEDIVSLYKFGAAPSRMAHMSEENMLAFGAISKKANIGGDEAGTAYRALIKNLMSPTAEARTAMAAAGIDFGHYQAAPKSMNLHGFTDEVARRYGVKLDARTQAGLGRIFSNPTLLGDAAQFTPAVTGYLKGALGGNDAKSLKSIAGLARSYRDSSVGGIDVNGLMSAVMQAISKNPALSNAMFGAKQGGRIFTALGDPAFYRQMLDQLQNHSQGFAQNVSDQRMAGFDGAMSKLKGSIKNLESAIGRAVDANGRGGLLTIATTKVGEFVQALAEADPRIQALSAGAVAATAGITALKSFDWLKGGFGLQASATMLDEAAMQLKGAAAHIAGGGMGVPGEPGAPGSKPGGPGRKPSGPGAKRLLPFLFGLPGVVFNAPNIGSGGDETRKSNYDAIEGFGNILKYYTFQDGLTKLLKGGGNSIRVDEDRLGRAKASDADPWFKELQRKEQESVWQFGQLNSSANVLKASFDGLAGTMSGMSGGGGAGVINASYETGGAGGGRGLDLSGAGRLGGKSVGHFYSAAVREANLRSAALAEGVDPRLVMATANAEGFHNFTGDRGTSFGDLQMHIGGGLGDKFRRVMRMNPADPHNELALDRFAVREIARGGWAPWHGAARIGIRGRMGIGRHPVGHALEGLDGVNVEPKVNTKHLERTAALLDHIHDRIGSINGGGMGAPAGSYRTAMNGSFTVDNWRRSG